MTWSFSSISADARLSARAGAIGGWASLRFLANSRLVLAMLLAVSVLLGGYQELIDTIGKRRLFEFVVILYCALSIAWVVLARRRRTSFDMQSFGQVGADLLLLTLLMHAAGGPQSGAGLLLVAAVGGFAVLSTMLRAAFVAAIATLLVLGEAAWNTWGSGWADVSQLTPAALVGAACFAIALLVNRLVTRLAIQEALAEQRGEDLQAQVAMMRLVISEMSQGVVIIDADGRVRTMNRTAQELLGQPGPWPHFEAIVRTWIGGDGTGGDGADRDDEQAGGSPDADGVEVELQVAAGGRGIAPQGGRRVRMRLLRTQQGHGSDAVVLVEDLRALEERAQQLKLASMGRLSASIAHEIRNPLAAIRHANGLLAERVDEGIHQRLTRIVEDNSVRIDRIVEDVLSIARRERPVREAVGVEPFINALVAEFAATQGIEATRVEVSALAVEPMSFDPRHLRQVLINLLSNALRYASQQPGAVRIEWRAGAGHQLELRVLDDGPGLSPENLAHVFEPFFTTESRGNGLGLFLAREFCGANGASLRYERLSGEARYSGAFVISPGQFMSGQGSPRQVSSGPGST